MKFGENQSAMRTVAAGALLLSAVAALTLGPLLPVVAAESDKDPVTTSAIGPAVKMRFLALGVGKSMVVDLPRDVKDVLVADPKIANAVVRSSQRAYIIGAAVGQTNVVFFDADGQQVASYDIAVKRDLNGVRAALRQIAAGNPDRGRRRRRDPDRLGIEPGRGPAGRRNRRATGRRRRTRSSTRSSFAAATR